MTSRAQEINIRREFDNMKKQKKLNKLKLGIVVILVVLALSISVFGRYIYNSVREAYFTARQFYFTSNILTANGARFQYNNWGGVDVYAIEFDLYSYLNVLERLDYDLNYTVTCSTEDADKIKCSINSYTESAPTTVTGTIPATTNISKVIIYITPLIQIEEGETVKIQVAASTSEPYQKTISCEFTVMRETPDGISYTIEDVENREYAILKMVNTSETGVEVTLEFDPSKLRIDSNNEIYINKKSIEKTTINGNEYVKKLIFDMSAESSKYVKFYKADKSKNYTYPGIQTTTPINITS